MNQDATVTFRPGGRKYLLYIGTSLFVGTALLVGMAVLPLVFSADSLSGAIILIYIVAPFALLAIWSVRKSMAMARARFVLSAQSLDIRAHEFRTGKACATQLPWEHVWGVQVYESPNLLAPDHMAHYYVIHTPSCRFAFDNMWWPEPAQIAGDICRRAGRSLNELSVSATPIAAINPRDRLGGYSFLGCLLIVFGVLLFLCVPLALVDIGLHVGLTFFVTAYASFYLAEILRDND